MLRHYSAGSLVLIVRLLTRPRAPHECPTPCTRHVVLLLSQHSLLVVSMPSCHPSASGVDEVGCCLLHVACLTCRQGNPQPVGLR